MNRDLLLSGISLIFWGIGEGMFLIFQPLYLQQLGATPVEIGAILGAAGIAMALVQAPAGYLTDRIGPRKVMWANWVLGLAATAVMAWAVSVPMFVAGLLTYGVTSCVTVPMNTYIARARGKWSMERAITINSAWYNAGMILGPLLGGMLGGRLGLQPVYRLSVVVIAISVVLIFFIRNYPAETAAGAAYPKSGLLANTRYLAFLGVVFVVMFGLYLPQPLTPNFLQNQRGLSLTAIGQMASLGGLSNVIMTLFLGSLNARIGLLAGQFLMLLFPLLLWKGSGLAWYGLAYGFIGGYRLSRLMLLAIARPMVSSTQTGMAFGFIETANAITIILAPLLAGFLYEQNPVSVYTFSLIWITGGFLLAMIALPVLQKRYDEPARLEAPQETTD